MEVDHQGNMDENHKQSSPIFTDVQHKSFLALSTGQKVQVCMFPFQGQGDLESLVVL